MNLKLSTLLCALAAAQIQAATPEAAMNAARMPEADVVLNISVAKIAASEFAKPALAFFEKGKALVAREEKEDVARLDAFIKTLKDENFSLADFKTVTFAYDTDDGDMPPFAIHFEKPLALEFLQKHAPVMIAWMEHGLEDVTIEPVAKGVRWTNRACNDNYLATLPLDANTIVYVGGEDLVKDAVKRLEDGKQAGFRPAMKILLDETLTRRDAYLAMSHSEELREIFDDMIFWGLDFDEDTPVGKKIKAAINALDGVTAGLDCAEKMSVTAALVFNAPEHAAFAGEFVSAVGFGAVKSGLFNLTGVAMPFMDSLKVSTQNQTVTVTAEVVAKDLEILLAGLEKMFPSAKP